MKKLGILIHQISTSQQYTTIANNLNIMCRNNPELDLIVFHNDLGRVAQPNEFALMQSTEALDYDGIVVAMDILSAHLLTKCLRAKKKYFYIWDVNWNLSNRPAIFMKDIYMNLDTELIARSKDHAELIKRVFREPKYIIEEFNHEQIIQNII